MPFKWSATEVQSNWSDKNIPKKEIVNQTNQSVLDTIDSPDVIERSDATKEKMDKIVGKIVAWEKLSAYEVEWFLKYNKKEINDYIEKMWEWEKKDLIVDYLLGDGEILVALGDMVGRDDVRQALKSWDRWTISKIFRGYFWPNKTEKILQYVGGFEILWFIVFGIPVMLAERSERSEEKRRKQKEKEERRRNMSPEERIIDKIAEFYSS